MLHHICWLTNGDHGGGVDVLDEFIEDRGAGDGLHAQPSVAQGSAQLYGEAHEQGYMQVALAGGFIVALGVQGREIQETTLRSEIWSNHKYANRLNTIS